ncbi:CHAP domain-containing protein [Arthrobacter sp. A2-55]|uniref:CHAP domain-containing protein n=1 Tax=Arthrobacter sp. A2-55 TaxID=2897337 RepID=UPI0021CD6AC0|nr:CHAP domain-containing protein [Arthrobacter sp. A2-55]MCU6479088.1 CHAP domain-containing protein [Arthrobacter sp. A2-55]
MSTPSPEESNDKTQASGSTPGSSSASVVDQAKDDLKASAAGIITSTVAGAAAGGGLPGAAVGALKGIGTAAIKTKTGRRGIAVLLLAPLLAAVLTLSVVLGGVGTGSGGMLMSAHASAAENVARTDFDNNAQFNVISGAADQTGVRWEVLAAIVHLESQRTIDRGVGPFGIDLAGADGIDSAGASDLGRAAVYIGQQLSKASEQTVNELPNSALDAGAVDTTNEDGTVTRKVSTAEDMQRAAADVKDQYVKALRQLPIKGNPDLAVNIFSLAQQWSLGANQQCATTNISLGGQTSLNLTDSQKKYAQAIINQVAAKNMPQQAAVIALATALQESTLRMWWNVKVPGSEALTDDKEAKGSDGYSVGLFQQQVNGNEYSWGTVSDAMNPAKSTDIFLERLKTIPGWETKAVSEAAQAVQVSAFPDAYAQWESQARQLVNDFKPTGGGGYQDPHAEEPATPGAPGTALKVNTATNTNLQAVEKSIIDKFSALVTAMLDTGQGGDHAEGRAVDAMIKDYKSPSGIKSGDAIASFMIANQAAFNIDYIIWRDRIWLGPVEGWKPYSTGGYGSMYAGNWNDTTLHMDHVHISVKSAPGTGGDYVYKPSDGSGASCPAGGVSGIAIGDSGTGDDYPYRQPAGDCAWCAFSADPGTDPWSLYKRECVSFVAWRMNQQMGWKPGEPYPFTPGKLGIGFFGNAEQWSSQLALAGYVTDKVPKKGAIAWWGAFGGLGIGSAGHVAVVKDVNEAAGTVTIEQYNAWPKEHAYSVQVMPASQVNGFIHVADTEK